MLFMRSLLTLKNLALTVFLGSSVTVAANTSEIASSTRALPGNELTSDILYQIIAGEFALQRRDASAAYHTYMEVARQTKDPRLAQRAFQIADTTHAFFEARTAADLWVDYSQGKDAAAIEAQLLARLRTGELSDANRQAALDWLKSHKKGSARYEAYRSLAKQADLGTQDKRKVLAFLEPLAAFCENQADAALSIARLYRQTGQIAKAAPLAKVAHEDMPENASAVLEYADLLMAKESTKAIDILEKFVKHQPKSYDVHLGLAKAYARTNNAVGVKKELAILDPKVAGSTALNYTMASIAGTVHLDQEAQKYLEAFESLALEKSEMIDRLPYAYFELGRIAYRGKRFAKAISWFAKVESQSSVFVHAKLLQANAYVYNHEKDKALQLLNKTKANKDGKIEFLRLEARILYDDNQKALAYQKLKSALNLAPTNKTLITQNAALLIELKRDKEAEALLKRSIDRHPDHADFYNTLGYLWAERGVNLIEAEKLLKRADTLKPNDAAILDSLGWLYYQMKNFNAAKAYLEKAASISNDETIWEHLKSVYEITGNKEGIERINAKMRTKGAQK